jgi:hypothetical protein
MQVPIRAPLRLSHVVAAPRSPSCPGQRGAVSPSFWSVPRGFKVYVRPPNRKALAEAKAGGRQNHPKGPQGDRFVQRLGTAERPLAAWRAFRPHNRRSWPGPSRRDSGQSRASGRRSGTSPDHGRGRRTSAINGPEGQPASRSERVPERTVIGLGPRTVRDWRLRSVAKRPTQAVRVD